HSTAVNVTLEGWHKSRLLLELPDSIFDDLPDAKTRVHSAHVINEHMLQAVELVPLRDELPESFMAEHGVAGHFRCQSSSQKEMALRPANQRRAIVLTCPSLPELNAARLHELSCRNQLNRALDKDKDFPYKAYLYLRAVTLRLSTV